MRKYSSSISAVLYILYIFDCPPHFWSSLTFQKTNRGTKKATLDQLQEFLCPRIMSMSNFNVFILWHEDKNAKLIVYNTTIPLNSPNPVQNDSF